MRRAGDFRRAARDHDLTPRTLFFGFSWALAHRIVVLILHGGIRRTARGSVTLLIARAFSCVPTSRSARSFPGCRPRGWISPDPRAGFASPCGTEHARISRICHRLRVSSPRAAHAGKGKQRQIVHSWALAPSHASGCGVCKMQQQSVEIASSQRFGLFGTHMVAAELPGAEDGTGLAVPGVVQTRRGNSLGLSLGFSFTFATTKGVAI
jgi:hypothetical protein